MNRPRPCRICRRWFYPHPRQGARQRVCSSSACQRERHRRACAGWHARNPGYDVEARLLKKLRAGPAPRSSPPEASPIRTPMTRLNWLAARDAVGPEVTVVVEESLRVVMSWTRDVVSSQSTTKSSVTGRHVPDGTRDAIATSPP